MASRRSLNALDRTLLAGETRESMMHVGALMLFSPPPEGAADSHRRLMDELRERWAVQPPWNVKLRHPDMLTSPLQAWVEDDRLDFHYHVRRSALPSPGDERELGILVSRLHSQPIDFHRPPWEMHLIEGLEGGRFALYVKVHHALVDGFTGTRLLTRALTEDPDDRDTPMFFSRLPPERGAAGHEHVPALHSLLLGLREQAGTSRDVGRALMRLARSRKAHDGKLVMPMQAPRSVLNARITRSRRFATQQYPVDRLKTVARRFGGTLNDVVLGICGSSLRRFLYEQAALPDESLTAMIPVNVRPKDDAGGGNAVGSVLAALGTDLKDPAERMRRIVASTTRAKEQLQGMSKAAIIQYSGLLMAPLLLSLVPGAIGRVRPAFNVVVSNVPGPEKPLYFRGWRLQAVYPVSIPFQGYALNVTVQSYAGTLNFGFIGCREAVPHLQRLAVYAGEALEEIEGA
jgi:diacylglycerol O-acyltransferase / wax synthase